MTSKEVESALGLAKLNISPGDRVWIATFDSADKSVFITLVFDRSNDEIKLKEMSQKGLK